MIEYCQYDRRGICRHCGNPITGDKPRPCPKPGASPPPLTPEQRAELRERQLAERERYAGDLIKDILKAAGVEYLFSEVRRECGLPPSCGGCEARQKWLNKVDKYVRGKVRAMIGERAPRRR